MQELDLARLRLVEDKGWMRLYRDLSTGEAYLEVDKSPRGKVLSKPVCVKFKMPPGRFGEKLVEYVVEALAPKAPGLIPFTLRNRSLQSLAGYLLRYRTGSRGTLFLYTYFIHRFSRWVGVEPDLLLEEFYTREGLLDQRRLAELADTLEAYLAELLAEGLSSSILTLAKASVNTWLEANRLTLPRRIPTPTRSNPYASRAPTPEELARAVEVADIRGKAIIAFLALTGVRVGTMVRLKIKHLEPDLSSNVTPVCIRVPATLNKRRACSYETFLGEEGVRYLKLYLDLRRRGTGNIPPEELTPESWLFIVKRSPPRPLTERGVRAYLSQVFRRAGILEEKPTLGRRYQLCVHSLRKYFKTQLASRGVPPEFVEYMMGHKTSTYLSVQSKGVEFLRSLYAASGISIKPQTRISKIDLLKEIVRSLGFDPEKVLVKRVLEQPHRTLDVDRETLEALQQALREAIKKEILDLKPDGSPFKI